MLLGKNIRALKARRITIQISLLFGTLKIKRKNLNKLCWVCFKVELVDARLNHKCLVPYFDIVDVTITLKTISDEN